MAKQLIIDGTPEVLEAIEALMINDSDTIAAIMADSFARTEEECDQVYAATVQEVELTYKQLFDAINGIRLANKESTEAMRRFIYTEGVQAIFKQIEGKDY